MQQKNKSPYYLPASIKDLDTKKGIVTGYFANFNTLDADNDIIVPGAFTKTISERGPASARPRIKYFIDHQPSLVPGVIKVLKEDNFGLYYEAQAGTHDLGKDFIKRVESGIITEHSFGYQVMKKETINPDAGWDKQQRRLTELQMWEGSALQTWGANENTPITGMKARIKVHAKIETIIKALATGTFTDETFGELKKELIFLQKAIETDYETTEPDSIEDTTQPNDEGKMLNVLQLMNANMNMRLQAIH